MPLQSSGAISLANVQTEFGGSNPIGINEYYGVAAGIPASGTISLNNFYGKSATAPVSATVVSNSVSLNEGNTVTFTINTTNFPSGTLYWTILTSNMNASDFTDFTGDALSGSITISSSVAYLARTLRNDLTTEGSESFALQVRTGSISGPVIATSPVVTVNDSSVGGFSGWNTYMFGVSNFESSSVSSNTFTGTLVTPGAANSPKNLDVNLSAETAGGAGFPTMSMQYYQGGSLNTTWTLTSSALVNYQTTNFTATFGSSSMQFVSSATDPNSYDDQYASNSVTVPTIFTTLLYHTVNLTGGGQYDIDYDD